MDQKQPKRNKHSQKWPIIQTQIFTSRSSLEALTGEWMDQADSLNEQKSIKPQKKRRKSLQKSTRHKCRNGMKRHQSTKNVNKSTGS